MEVVIKDIVSRSFADSSYPKAIKALETYRTEAIEVPPSASRKTDSGSWMSRVSTTTFYRHSRKTYLGESWEGIEKISGR